LLFLLLLTVLAISFVARLYALAPVKVMDTSMVPKFKERSIHWMCKLPQCLAKIKDQDIVWVSLKSGETMLRNVLAMPGDTIEITDKGHVRTPHRNFKWKGEDAFIQSKTIYVPKAGDTLYFDQLNEVEQDYALAYLHTHGQKVAVKSSLWQGDREINIDRVGATKIANRQVSLKEIDFLPWQDRYLIELQIRQSEPGNDHIKIKRQLFTLKPKRIELSPPPTQTDSATTIADSVAVADSVAKADSTEKKDSSQTKAAVTEEKEEDVFDEPMNQIVIEEDCYFLTCTKGSSCPDSRELGYFTKKDFIGKYIEAPDRVMKKVVVPIKHYASIAIDYAMSLLFPEEEPKTDENQTDEVKSEAPKSDNTKGESTKSSEPKKE
jgi:signal peptidase I